MKRVIRLALVAGVAVVSLAITSSAWASYSPSLTVTTSKNAPGAQTSVLLGHVQSPADDATAKDTIYAPLGYTLNLSQPAGTKIGDVSARLILRGGGNAEVDVDGHVVADNPANHPNDACAPGMHAAVWNLNITVAGTPLTVPIYVDPVTAGPEATFASAKIQLCLAGPIGTPAGAQLEFAFFDVDNVFSNPSNTTDRIWHATFTPYVSGQPVPNPAGTTEGQAVIPGRVALTMKTKSLKHGRVIVSGKLTVDGQAFGGTRVELYKGDKLIGHGNTNRKGNYTIRIKVKKKTRVLAQVLFLGDLPSCPAPGLPGVPQGCKSATLSFFAAKIGTARHKK
jgi:hypothetical protein